MSDRFIPERIRDFLIQRPARLYCDSCIQERLGLRWRQQVQLVTATLAVTKSFTRERGVCCTCHETKQVTAAMRALPQEDAPALQSSASPTQRAIPSQRHSVKLLLAQQRTR
jgi:hypothetical protein